MHQSVRRPLCALVLIAAFSPLTLSATAIWFGDKDGLHQVDPPSNRVVLNVAFEPPVSIAVSAGDGSVWILTQTQLARLNSQGILQFQRALRDDLGNGIGAPRLLALNPNDGTVWAAFANRVLHFDAAGVLRADLSLAARDFAIAQDGTLWVITATAVQQFDSAGTALRSIPLTSLTQGAKYLVLNDAGGVMWLAGERNLLALSLSDPNEITRELLAPEPISAVSVNAQTGDLWVLGQNTLSSYRGDGTPVVSRDLRDFSISNPNTLVFDFATQAAWVGHQGGLARISADGTLAAAFVATTKVAAIAIGRTLVEVDPMVTLASPADGSLLNSSTPLFRVKYDALCGGVSCGFPNSFFSGFTLSASLNGNEVGPSFVFDPTTGGATFTPDVPLPEGPNSFTAQAHAFGRSSNTVSASFTIDSIAPGFNTVTPANGSVFTTTSTITIAGSVDDSTAAVSLGSQSQGSSFSFAVTLAEGVNNFMLEAKDPAGNTRSLALAYTYSPPANVPPTVSMTAPAGGASFSAPASIPVAANATDPDGTVVRVEFLRNGIVEATDTTAPFEATLTNVPAGTQTLTARAVDDRGATTLAAAVTVNVTATSITIMSPAADAVINADNVVVTGRIVALSNSGVSVNNTVASVDASGNFTALISLTAGANTIAATLATADGTVLTVSRSVTSTGRTSPFSAIADPPIGIAPLTVVFRISNPTGVAATVTSNVFNTFTLPAGATASGSRAFAAGVFVATFTFTNASGTFTHNLVIESRDTAQMDQMFRAIWTGLNSALVAGDKTGAMRYLNGKAKTKFGPVFDVLMPFMSQIVASYSTLARSSITSDIGSYAVVRLDNDVRRIYFIYFMRDPDGVWRIDEM
jgi:hypothetical protein